MFLKETAFGFIFYFLFHCDLFPLYLLTLDLIRSYFSSFWWWKMWSLIWDFFSNINIYCYNFPLRNCFNGIPQILLFCFHLHSFQNTQNIHLIKNTFSFPPSVNFSTHKAFRDMLIFQHLVIFQRLYFVWLESFWIYWNLFYSENMLYFCTSSFCTWEECFLLVMPWVFSKCQLD